MWKSIMTMHVESAALASIECGIMAKSLGIKRTAFAWESVDSAEESGINSD
jgi:hypothetical protein